ncbi:DNA double-strand break repair Rad50 ATPase [Actinidia chinensis var. chinensis]|uniref:DNA double-strand break repair Rad50 ATPase n=1 Tax=Actinidia chinensis var. chinensis TaxID=1590841 RepID=A0A2R6Q5W8_ACTCC|nr:DNA double-strand break repair Rad50 ATPase [Actinidia chinensis var. chinensis]
MDLGCIDLGCIEKKSNETFLDSEISMNDSVMSASKVGKTQNKGSKETAPSNMNALNKFTSQIKKPPHRKSSPLSWFPRKKVDSYLKRKIKLLQEVGGMNSTLDETLGDSNPHYSRVLREKIAVKEAAHKAMEARRAAMVEASWCRILQAARIQSKEAEAFLLEAEKTATEAFEAAKAIGVVMYDMPDCPQKHYEIETSSLNEGRSTTHTVTASFETAFEVDKQVAAAVKSAFVKLASCTSINKDEFKELLRNISQNPDTGEGNQELSEFSSECESDTGSELESGLHNVGFSSQDLNGEKTVAEVKQRKYKKKKPFETLNMTKLVDMMLKRLRCLQEDELASLATIVATCGLNAALEEAEKSKQLNIDPSADFTSAPNLPRRISSFDGHMRRKQVEADLPSLDKFLVKRLTKLEREVQEAKNARMNEVKDESGEKPDKSNDDNTKTTSDLASILMKHSSKLEKEIKEAKKNSDNMYGKEHRNSNSEMSSSEVIPDLGSILTKHSSKLEKEIEETKRNCQNLYEMKGRKLERTRRGVIRHTKQEVADLPSLDKFLVRHVSRLEREVQEAKDRREFKPTDVKNEVEKENIDLNKKEDGGLAVEQKEVALTLEPENTRNCSSEPLVVQIQQTNPEDAETLSLQDGKNERKTSQEKEKYGGASVGDCESLDQVLVKHVSRIEKEKMEMGTKEEAVNVKRKDPNTLPGIGEGSLDQILIKHKSRLEKEKIAAASQQPNDKIKQSLSRREVRDRELQEAWGGLSLGNSIRPHLSRLEQKEKIAAASQQPNDQIKQSLSRREARDRELQEAWGGLSLGNSIRPHLSRLERDKATWLKAEEEERRRAMEEL